MSIDWQEVLYFLIAVMIFGGPFLPEIISYIIPKFSERYNKIFDKFKLVRGILFKISQHVIAIIFVWVGLSYFVDQINTIWLHHSGDEFIYKPLSYFLIIYWGYRMIPRYKQK